LPEVTIPWFEFYGQLKAHYKKGTDIPSVPLKEGNDRLY